ncbi:MAG: FHA domain-containing protein [Polyangiaceae bacterium]
MPLQHGDHVQIGDYRLLILHDATEPTLAPQSEVVAAAWLSGRPPRLVMLAGPPPRAEFPLSKLRMTIGRGHGVDIFIDHHAVSRRHCEVVALEGGRYEVVDLGSANGLLVHGQQLRRAILDTGDVLVLGDEVALKYVQAGDVFRPGPYDSRALRPVSSQRVWTTLVPLLVFVVIVLIGGAWAMLWFFAGR